jgi:ABC-2 type transport system ATP-binding protein
MTDAIVHCTGLSKNYAATQALRDLQFSVTPGTIVGLLGENGAGKSTLLRILACIHRTSHGSASVFGLDVQKHPVTIRERLGYVPQQPSFHRWMTVAEVLWFHSAFFPTWDTELAEGLRKQLRLDPAKLAGDLTAGMAMRLALIVAVSPRPELLLLDEPLAGLDPSVREDVLELIVATHHDHGGTILLSSHQTAEIDSLIDHVLFLEDGKLLVNEERSRLLNSLRRIEITFEESPPQRVDISGQLRQRRSGQRLIVDVQDYVEGQEQQLALEGVRSVQTHRLSLEDAFVALAKRGA